MSRISFSPVRPEHHDLLRFPLEAARVPTHDLTEPDCSFFHLSDEDGPIGFSELKGAGPDQLLRSLVVLPSRKQKGHGCHLVAHIEAFARQAGAARLHLLTTTAADFLAPAVTV